MRLFRVSRAMQKGAVENGQYSTSHGGASSWDYGPIDAARLKERSLLYARAAGAGEKLQGSLTELLDSDLGKAIIDLPEEQLFGMVLNDFYKPKMHKLYSALYTGVEADFQLKIRKTPFTLERIRNEDPELFASFEKQVMGIMTLKPDLQEECIILDTYSGFSMSQAEESRSTKSHVAPVSWAASASGQPLLVASGVASPRVMIIDAPCPIQAASNAETSITQITQQYIIRAQAGSLFRTRGIHIDRTERVANALGHLMGVLQKLSAVSDSGVKMALFAGRRSTDRIFLLLQNLLCARHLPNYMGTSSVYAVSLMDRTARRLGMTHPEQRHQLTGSLVGTHAHELMMMTAQLLAAYDDKAGTQTGSPVPIAALLAHLLFLREVGGLAEPTALSDTFGTEAFIETAVRTELPAEFLQDMRNRHPSVLAHLPAKPVVFDVFSSWRLDSGSYADMAEAVVSAWERRCAALQLGDVHPPRPHLMHSNLSSVDEVAEVCRLPERIRPSACAFGSLADNFLPFQLEDGSTAQIPTASIVMKAVQARLGRTAAHEASTAAASNSSGDGCGKLGDDADKSKAQVDLRLAPDAQERLKHRMAQMFSVRDIDGAAASAALRDAYHDVTRRKILCAPAEAVT